MGIESTIISLLDDPVILRPGNITTNEVQSILGHGITMLNDTGTITAPGQLTSHYAPNASLRLNANTLREATANLFSMLHELDAREGSKIAVAPIPNHGLGVAINDRLTRAAAPKN